MEGMERAEIAEGRERMQEVEKERSSGKNSSDLEKQNDLTQFSTTSIGQKKGRSRKGYDFGVITDRILKCAVEVHSELGPYFMETTYQAALALELHGEGLNFARECWVDIVYKGHKVDKRRVDFLVEDVLVEIKAKAVLEDKDYIQTLAYLKSTGYTIGLLINFGGKKIEVRRLQWTPKKEGEKGKGMS